MSQLAGVLGNDPADIIIRVLAFAIPVAILLTLIVVLGVKTKAKRKRSAEPATIVDIAAKARVVAPAGEPQVKLVQAAAPALKNPIEAVQMQVQDALKNGIKTQLAPLYLQLSALYRADANQAEYLSALRAAAGLGAQHGPRSAHAQARLELAEAAYDAGDLHGACEQWQMARTALLDDGQKDAHARVDKRMRDNGCPTDWVLTDF